MEDEAILGCLNTNNFKYKSLLEKAKQNRLKRNKMKCKSSSPIIFQRHFRSNSKKSVGFAKSIKDTKWIWKHFAVIKKQILEQLRSTKGMEMKIWLLMKMKEIVELRNLGRTQLESCRSRRQLQFHGELFSRVNEYVTTKATNVVALNYRDDISNAYNNVKDNIFHLQKCSVRLQISLNYINSIRNCIDGNFLKNYHSLMYGRVIYRGKPNGSYEKSLFKMNGECIIFEGRFFNVETKVNVQRIELTMDSKCDEEGVTQQNIPSPQISGNQKESFSKIRKHIGRRKNRLAKLKRKFIHNRELEAELKKRRLSQMYRKKTREIIVSAIKRYCRARKHLEKENSKQSHKFNQKLQHELEQNLKYRAKTQLKQYRKRKMIVKGIQKFWDFQNKLRLETSSKLISFKAAQENARKKRARKHRKKIDKFAFMGGIHEISDEEHINLKAEAKVSNGVFTRKLEIANLSVEKYNRDILLKAIYQLWVHKGLISSNESQLEEQLGNKEYDNQRYGMAIAKRSRKGKKRSKWNKYDDNSKLCQI